MILQELLKMQIWLLVAMLFRLSAKFFVQNNGDTVLQNRGILNDREIRKIQGFIKENYLEMYQKWARYSQQGFYGDK